MVKVKRSRFRFKCGTPRQTRWNRKYRNKSMAPAADTDGSSCTENGDQSFEDCDQVSLTGNVMDYEDWDLSSVSSHDYEGRVYVSDDSFEDSSDQSTFSADHEHSFSDIPLHSDISITKRESMYMVLAFSRKTNLSRDATEDLMKLIKLHLPKSVKYPTSYFQLEKQLDISPVKSKEYTYCENFHLIQEGFCTECESEMDEIKLKQEGKYFIIFDIRSQVQQMLQSKTIKEHLTASIQKRLSMNATDVKNIYGSRYAESVTSWNISGIGNTDGVPVFKSSKSSIWPVLIAIKELPYLVRKSNIILVALWSGPEKICVDLVFSQLVPMLNDLQSEGILWTNSLGDLILSKFFVQKWSVDALARCLLQGITQFNGAFGCSHCKEKGKVVPKGRGRCRVFTRTTNLPLRSDNEHRSLAFSAESQYGIKCATPLLQINNFDIFRGTVIEPMHNLFLGVSKSVINLWLTLKHSDCFLGSQEKLELLNTRMRRCKVPTEIVRTVRDLTSRKHWKASEYRTSLFIFTIITRDLLPKTYHRHFCKFANSIYLLSLPICESRKVLTARRMLISFVRNIANLYGEEYMSYNVHCLLHLSQCCDDWGPLWQFSAFMFESFNAVLLKYISNANSVQSQISRKVKLDAHTRYSAESVFRNDDAMKTFCAFAKSPRLMVNRFFLNQPYKVFNADESLLRKIALLAKPRCLFSAKSAVIDGYLFKVKETEKRADCYVKLGETHIGRITAFLCIKCDCETDCQCKRECAVVDSFRVAKVTFSEFAFQCSSSTRTKQKVIALRDLSGDKFFKLEYDGILYFLHVCNLFEID